MTVSFLFFHFVERNGFILRIIRNNGIIYNLNFDSVVGMCLSEPNSSIFVLYSCL